MDAMVHCQSCETALRVPRNGSGHRARCPACGIHFIIPPEHELLEETFSLWIEQDVEEVLHRREDLLEEQQPTDSSQAPAASRQGAADATATAASPDGADHQEEDEPGVSPFDLPPLPASRPEPPPPPKAAPRPAPEPAAKAPDHPAPPADPQDAPPAGEYPQNLHVTDPIPHLVVLRCDHLGVRMGFDAQWLTHPGFQASMPVRCVFSGASHRDQLIARPLVFIDRSRIKRPSIDQLTALHEHRVLGDRSPRELVGIMGKLEAMPYPFNFAVPYYVSTRYAHMYLHCETRDRSDGGITCEVLIPDAVTGLEWLAKVNGVCGKEYELLEYDASLLHGEAWKQLSDQARQRIAVWCKLRPREVLRLYLSDADFGRRDEGLAGLIVTDQRLVFCKYHHRGQVPLDEDASVHARCDARFANLSLHVGAERSRMVKVHRDDLDRLAPLLDNDRGVRLVISDG